MSHDHDPRAERPILLQDHYLIQKMQAFNRERVPERIVQAKGGGAFGYFQVVGNIVGRMADGVERRVQERAVALWRRVDPDLGARIAERLGLAARRAPVEADAL